MQVDSNKAKWYIDIVPDLERYLKEAISSGDLPQYKEKLGSKEGERNVEANGGRETLVNAPTPDQEPDLNVEDNFEEKDSLRWLSCRISESVPAGGFGPVGYDPNPVGFLEISEILIENEKYLVNSIRRTLMRRNAVNISPQFQYMTIYVKGTSMNAAKPVPIDDGDYILVKAQNIADDNEIVVAAIFGQDELATVKRIKCNDGKIRLIPESNDPSHNELNLEKEFNEFGGEFMIIGVVEAVFKKKKK